MKELKCVVWDLDGTLWDGILAESNDVKLKPDIQKILKTLDSRGILHSIASKNNYEDAMFKLREFKLDQYFLYPEITWNAKSFSIAQIQKNLAIGMDTLLFVDDEQFEREEVQSAHPEITCMDSSLYLYLPDCERLNPRFITSDGKRRRLMYLEDVMRRTLEEEYRGPRKEFLKSLNMQLFISRAQAEDLKRAEELTLRTNQLNATGRTYGFEELEMFMHSKCYELILCELKDKYGSYGKIGLALVEMGEEHWHIRLLLVSCRVMSHGVGTMLLSHIMQEARKAQKKLLADFRHTGRNKLMYIALKFAGFRERGSDGNDNIILECDLSLIQQLPSYVTYCVDCFSGS